ncbi:hypothetical protein ILUMI_06844 [Ignelater luminosus]|uniref:Farnesol dehydrogenase n=1 Tax=Ignelater luminosus TaxID=2038154 RepID=A0A8K0D4J2_IGNLU|nr:hypothetical protein ILUMI_17046 [Ignelater luminosus]KAF2899330.1 hypothetical protein ILUMI_06844 [Ignelater luminosus]
MAISMERWKGKVAVVTGASAGIGAAAVEKLVDTGLKVVGLARRKEKLDELSKKLQNKPGKFYSFKADVSNENDIIEAFTWIKKNVGPVSILINNAGVSKNTNLVDGEAKDWKAVLDINVLGLCIATREAIKHMRASNIDGHIIHINSVTGHIVTSIPQLNVYPASKYAVTALTETLRQELNSIGSKIRITSLSPGSVKTEFREAGGYETSEEVKKFFDKAPMLTGEDIADAIIYILSTPPHVQIHELTIKPVGEAV